MTQIDQVPNTSQKHPLKIHVFGYWYHLFKGITYGLAQSDPNKRRPLYWQPLTVDLL
jgi:hypothetical protein